MQELFIAKIANEKHLDEQFVEVGLILTNKPGVLSSGTS